MELKYTEYFLLLTTLFLQIWKTNFTHLLAYYTSPWVIDGDDCETISGMKNGVFWDVTPCGSYPRRRHSS
jgi:hypothetical protein